MNRFQREKRESHLHVKSVQYQTLIDQMCCNRLRGMLIVGFSYAKSALIYLSVFLEVCFLTNVQINIGVRFCSFMLVSSKCEVILTACYFVY